MKVYIVYDPLYEKVISVHKNEENAMKRSREMDKKDGRDPHEIYLHEWDEYGLED